MRHRCQYSHAYLPADKRKHDASSPMGTPRSRPRRRCKGFDSLAVICPINTDRKDLEGKYLLDKLKTPRLPFTRARVLRKCKVSSGRGGRRVGGRGDAGVAGKSYYTGSFCKNLLRERARVPFEETPLYYTAFTVPLDNLIGYLSPSLLCVIIKSKGE